MPKKPRAEINGIPVWCAHDKIVACAELIPNPKNPNTHPKKQLELLAKIIKAQGWRAPITVSKRSGFIVKGHGRLDAANMGGIEKAPVDFQDYESEAVEHADMVADNRLAELAKIDKATLSSLIEELKLTDIDMEISGFSQDELDKHFLTERHGMTNEDDAPGLKQNTTTKQGDLYILGDHRLLCGDSTSTEIIKTVLEDDNATMIFTDPPYNVDYEGQTSEKLKIKNDKFKGKDFEEFLFSAISAFKCHVLGDVYICMSSGELHTLFSAFDSCGGHWSTFIIWVKNTFTIGRSNYQRQYEPILYGWFNGTSHYWSGVRNLGDVINGDLMYDGDGVPLVRVEAGGIESDIWNFPKPARNKIHPTMKPVSLCKRAITNSSKKNDIVFDGFGGSGSTMIACEKTYRRCRMVELDPLYCDVIVKRWEDFTGKKARLK